MERDMDGTMRFWDRIAEKYARQPIADEEAYQRKLEITRRYLQPDTKVLEFGCGTGSTALLHAPHVKHIDALDISKGMLDIARRKAAAAGVSNVTFTQADINDFDAPPTSFDVILGLSILHLLADRDAAIAKAHALLKPGGAFVTSTACLGDTMGYFKLIAPLGRVVGLLPLVRVFKQKDLIASLTAAGFVIEEEWRPDKSLAVFVVARKPEAASLN
jgi:ubiquinone/menaquinone biosynthesis C-methylase UbiE